MVQVPHSPFGQSSKHKDFFLSPGLWGCMSSDDISHVTDLGFWYWDNLLGDAGYQSPPFEAFVGTGCHGELYLATSFG